MSSSFVKYKRIEMMSFKRKEFKQMRFLSLVIHKKLKDMKYFFYLIIFVLGCLNAQAQWSFTSTIQVRGNCGGYNNPYLQPIPIQNMPTKSECEAIRQQFLNITASAGGCTAYYVCTPCTGSDIATSSQTGPSGTNSGGPQEGSAYFTTNPAQAMQNWSEDYARQQEALGTVPRGLELLQTGNARFDSQYYEEFQQYMVNPNEITMPSSTGRGIGRSNSPAENTEKYNPDPAIIDSYLNDWKNDIVKFKDKFAYNPDIDLSSFLLELYREKTGKDITAILSKVPFTEEDKRAIREYNTFAEKATDAMLNDLNEVKKEINQYETKKEIDRAILANDVYNPNSSELQKTDWKLAIDANEYDNINLQLLVMQLNKFNNKDGFYAALYKNEQTGEYTLSFRGSEMELADWYENFAQGVGLSNQYSYAAQIGEILKNCKTDGVNIDIVGHSLGGGLATIAALKSGCTDRTYTYNQAELSTSTVFWQNVDVSKIGEIKAYHSSTDILTNIQSVVNIAKSTINPLSLSDPLFVTNENKENVGNTVPVNSVVDLVLVPVAKGHSMEPMQKYFENKYKETQEKWNNNNKMQDVIKKAKSNGSLKMKRSLYPGFE